MALYKSWHVYQWNKIESPDVISYNYGILVFDKDAKKSVHKYNKIIIFNKLYWKKYKHAEIETIFFSVTLHKLKCNWLKDDKIIPTTLKLIEEKDRLTIQDILHTGQNISNRTFYRTTTFSISAENENNKW